ncbi:phosphatase PAP2 family protein [Ideonella livida]|uniref:Phosphatase PAP2 family protein n=1 Tax=Ideonella livida TaxID=2707176 RepID=A0A7C9PJU3_9BURK|nr:phosphatase PAP2 family protein [Ideonella livida]NDY93011.1 phosphatase PAP2 family protein [Ideonella livida]
MQVDVMPMVQSKKVTESDDWDGGGTDTDDSARAKHKPQDKVMALAWIDTEEGRAWRAGAMAWWPVEFRGRLRVPRSTRRDPDEVALPREPELGNDGTWGLFGGWAAWGEAYRDEVKRQPEFLGPAADWKCIVEPLKELLGRQNKSAQEGAVRQARCHRAGATPAILAQNGSVWDAIAPVLAVAGVQPHAPEQAPMAEYLWRSLQAMRPVLFYAKAHFNLARPFWQDGHSTPATVIAMPAHPSYPAGHAAAAYLAALLLKAAGRGDWARLVNAVETVAFNRVIAGVHYPMDANAGFMLAERVFEMLKQNDDWKTCLQKVARQQNEQQENLPSLKPHLEF